MSTASLPMYDFPDARDATDAWWTGIRVCSYTRYNSVCGIVATGATVE